jgi:hypothetical protein
MIVSRFVFVSLSLILFMPLMTWGNSLPQSIGPLALVKLQSGEEARKEIDRLHGKQLGYREGYIGTYADGDGKAKLWVSEYGSLEEAAKATAKMVQGMKGGEQKNFWHFQEIPIEGVPVYFVVGMGQAHYFFQKGVKVIWLAVDPPLAKQAIRDLLGEMP